MKIKTLLFAIFVPFVAVAQYSIKAAHLDTLVREDHIPFPGRMYTFNLPTSSGILLLMGNNYGQPDSMAVLGQDGKTIWRSPWYVGYDKSANKTCRAGPFVWFDTTLISEMTPGCFYDSTMYYFETFGIWTLLLNTTGHTQVSLQMTMADEGSDWEFLARYYSLPEVIGGCGRLATLESSDTTWYQADEMEISRKIACFPYPWTIRNPALDNPPTFRVIPEGLLQPGQLVTVQIDNHGSVFDWRLADGTKFVNPSDFIAQQDTVIVIHDECDTFVYPIHVLRDVYLPNAIHPGSNTGNGEWWPQWETGHEPAIYTWMIYDRWGSEVFRGQQGSTWDGRYNGRPLVPDVYLVILLVDGIVYRTGSIALVR